MKLTEAGLSLIYCEAIAKRYEQRAGCIVPLRAPAASVPEAAANIIQFRKERGK